MMVTTFLLKGKHVVEVTKHADFTVLTISGRDDDITFHASSVADVERLAFHIVKACALPREVAE